MEIIEYGRIEKRFPPQEGDGNRIAPLLQIISCPMMKRITTFGTTPPIPIGEYLETLLPS